MKTTKQHAALSQTVIALAVLSIFSPAHAEDDIAQLIKPESTVSVGLGAVSGDERDRAIFGQYNGMRRQDVYGLVDLEYVKRDDATGTWMIVKGSNLGLSSRELSFSREKQGDWKYSADFSQLERNYPRTINTGMTGAGSTTPAVARLATAGTGADIDLKTKRTSAGLGFEKWITPSLQFEAVFKNEEKKGARIWGRGYACAAYVCAGTAATGVSSALLLLPEPIDSVTKQIDAKLNFHTDKLLISAGYYGSFYNNTNGNLTATVPNSFNNASAAALPGYGAAAGGTSLQNVMQSPVALPPDNEAHQFYLDGNYAYSQATKMNFKVGYTHAKQNDSFAGMGLPDAPAGMSSLGARVDTTNAQLGFTTRATDKLSFLGDARYEHKDDKTPVALYNIENLETWNNGKTTEKKIAAKLEAGYRFTPGVRATLGLDHSSVERETPQTVSDENVAGLNALRGKNRENGYRAELRTGMSETLNGAITYSSSKRSGSDWTSLSKTTSAALLNKYCGGVSCYGQELPGTSIVGLSATAAFPVFMTDLDRDKWKLSADWNPTERLSLQIVFEDGTDKSRAPFNPVAGGKGWRDTGFSLYSFDVAYDVSENWKLTAYASQGDQTLHINHSSGYLADINDMNHSAGLGLVGKLSSQLDVGVNASYLNDVNKYKIDATTGTSGTLPGALTATAPSAANAAQAAIGLPNATFRQVSVNMFGKYALDKASAVRVDVIHQRVRFNEWQWSNNGVPFVYADNTSVTMQQNQNVTFVGVAYIRKF